MADTSITAATPEPASPAVSGPSAASLASLLEHLPGIVLCIDPQWFLVYANAEARRLGRLESETPRRLLRELYPEIAGTPFDALLREVMATQVPGHIEHLCPRFGGWLDLHILPLGEDGIAIHGRSIEDRKLTEALNESLSLRAMQVFDASPNSIVCFNRDWICTYFNRTSSRVLHLENMLGTHLWTRFPATLREPFHSNLVRAMNERVPVEFDAHTGGRLRLWMRVWVRPYEDGVVIFAGDITDRKRAEAARDANIRQLKQVVESTYDGVIGLSTDWTVLFINRQAARILRRDDLVGRNLWEEFPATGAHHLEQNRRAMIDRIPTDFEMFYPEPLNCWFSVQCRPSEEGMIAFFRDITEHRQNSEALLRQREESERQRAELQTIYDTAPIGLSLFDPVEFRFLRLNRRQADFYGLQPAEILGKTITELTPIPGLREMFEQVRAGIPIVNQLLEGRMTTDEPGAHRYWTVNYLPVYDAEGQVQAISGASLEVTHQKKAELALIQSEKLAAVGRLASSISHEINNPLEAIINLLFLINLDEKLPDAVRTYVNMAQSELGRVSQIVTQTLRFHRQAVKPTSVTAAELVDAVLRLYQGRLTNSGISVDTRYNTSTRILCFENDIRQVLNNLIANSIDAMRGGGRLLIRAHDTTAWDPGTKRSRKGVRITIADTGHGIPSEVRPHIFEPFYTTKALNGTGLGLWISEGIVAHHQGRLTMRSTQTASMHGTVFCLFLPINSTPAANS